MSVTGYYTLKLQCDNRHALTDFSAGVYFAPTRLEAKAEAREKGWMLSRYDRVFCPSCAEKRREERVR